MGRYAIDETGRCRSVRRRSGATTPPATFRQRVRSMTERQRMRIGAMLAWIEGRKQDEVDRDDALRLVLLPIVLVLGVSTPAVMMLMLDDACSFFCDFAYWLPMVVLGTYMSGLLGLLMRDRN